ncbi:uncharacterized protein [Musca autumnalis]|uniref:uncharacterized protein n=1 Tax=Musca autumnalis TaxID=221902 RepID=UPI003CF24AAA
MSLLLNLTLDSVEPTQTLPLIMALVWIINKDYAIYGTSPITIGQYAKNWRNRRYQGDLVDEVLRRAQTPHPQIRYQVEGELYPKDMSEENMSSDELLERFYKSYANREKSIWFLDSLEGYLKFERDLLDPKHHYHRSGYFVLVYTGKEADRLNNIKEMFRRLFSIYVTNVNVMLMVGKYPYLYTYFPFTPNKCHSSNPSYFASFKGIEKNANFTLGKSLFPTKVENMHGCTLTILTWTYLPYIVVERNEETGELISLHGIEGSVISVLAERMNFTIRVKEPNPKDRGDIYPNGTATGAAKMILEREANITIISYMYNKDRADHMSASASYLNLPYILAMPKGKPLTPFQRLIKPFRYIIWSCFTSSFFFAILMIYYVRFLGKTKLIDFIFGQGNRLPFTNLLSTLLGGAVYSILPYRNFARFLLTVWILYTLVLRTAYSGALYNILQDGKARNNLQTLQEVVDHNFTIYAFPAVAKVLEFLDPKPNIGVVDAVNTVPKLFEKISDVDNREKVALCLLEYSIRSYNQMNPTRRVEILPQALITTPIVFYMPHHSYIRDQTGQLIMQMLQAGIMKRLESVYLYIAWKSQRSQGEPTRLSFHLLLGIFSAYAVFLIFCFFVFLLELCSSRVGWLRGLLEFLNV